MKSNRYAFRDNDGIPYVVDKFDHTTIFYKGNKKKPDDFEMIGSIPINFKSPIEINPKQNKMKTFIKKYWVLALIIIVFAFLCTLGLWA